MKYILINDVFGDYKNSCKYVANEIEKQLNNKPNSTFILPTGSTPMVVYDELSERDLDWSKATTYNLDEYLIVQSKNRHMNILWMRCYLTILI